MIRRRSRRPHTQGGIRIRSLLGRVSVRRDRGDWRGYVRPVPEFPQAEEAVTVAEDVAAEPVVEVEDAVALEDVAETDDAGTELPGGDASTDGPSELR